MPQPTLLSRFAGGTPTRTHGFVTTEVSKIVELPGTIIVLWNLPGAYISGGSVMMTILLRLFWSDASACCTATRGSYCAIHGSFASTSTAGGWVSKAPGF